MLHQTKILYWSTIIYLYDFSSFSYSFNKIRKYIFYYKIYIYNLPIGTV